MDIIRRPNIDDVIKYLQKMKEEGYKYVELIDDGRALGWKSDKPMIDFIVSEDEPYVIGIDARSNRMKEQR